MFVFTLFLLQWGLVQADNPYVADASTLHLWHLDETTGDYLDFNGKAVGNPMNVPLMARYACLRTRHWVGWLQRLPKIPNTRYDWVRILTR